VRPLLLVSLAALALAAPAFGAKPAKKPASGHATTVCRNRIINQWEGTGKIKTTYPIACYRAALAFVNGKADLSTYSSLGDDIKLALQSALQRQKGDRKVPLDVGTHYNTKNQPGTTVAGGGSNGGGGTPTTTGGGAAAGGGGTTTTGPVITKPPAQGHPTGQALGPVDDSGSGTPLPLIVLGALALALIAAGAIGSGIRWHRRRP
jgi:hypothetical protein